MGNCIGLHCHPHHHVRARVQCGRGRANIEPPMPAITNIQSRLFDGRKIVPCNKPRSPRPLDPAPKPKEAPDGSGHYVKIVVTRKQLESMLDDITCAKDIAVRFLEKPWVEGECWKWRPSLATIPEVRKF